MKRIRNKYQLIFTVLGIYSIISVLLFVRLEPVIVSPESSKVVVGTNTSQIVSPTHRYKDDVVRGNDIQKAVARDVARFRKDCSDKTWALEILYASDGLFQINERICQKLPTQQHVNHLYGDDPVVYGMETCEQFRRNVQQVQREQKRAIPTVRVAGLHNTGTNAMAVSLARNLQQDYHMWDTKVLHKFDRKRDELFNVPWEKHVPPRFRNETNQVVEHDRGIDFRLVLPVVLVRDPYWWMQSMCKQSYDISWKKRGENRCPNIVNADGINAVRAHYEKKFPMQYDSLVHVWNEWNQEYFEADFPRLMIRFEDQLFHGEKVMQLISDCSGIPLKRPYLYQWRESKKHGSSSNLISALSKYGNVRGRQSPLDAKDLEYAQATLNPPLMQLFGYPHKVIPPRVSHAYRKKLGKAWGG